MNVGSQLRSTRIVLQHRNISSPDTFPNLALISEKKDILHQSISIWEAQPRQEEFVRSVEIGEAYKKRYLVTPLIYVPVAIYNCFKGVELGQTVEGCSSGCLTVIDFCKAIHVTRFVYTCSCFQADS